MTEGGRTDLLIGDLYAACAVNISDDIIIVESVVIEFDQRTVSGKSRGD